MNTTDENAAKKDAPGEGRGEPIAPVNGPAKKPGEQRRSLLRSFLPARALQWVGAAAVFAVLAGVMGGAILLSGRGPLSAVSPHYEGVASVLSFASSRVFAHNAGESPLSTEPLDSPAMIMRGAAYYALVCADCHGAPGFGQNPVSLSSRPEPPLLVDVSKKRSDNELYYVVKNGVRYTGMPAWPVQNRPDEVWAMVAFLKAMPSMDRATYLTLVSGREEGAPVRQPSGNEANAATSETAKSLAPFVPSPGETRPYLPGDVQETAFSSPAATVLPRTGYVTVTRGDLAASCVSCHGPDNMGRADGSFPNLTLQSPQYIYDSLQAFASGRRQSGVMWLVAASLSDEQMRSLSAQIGTAPARSRLDQEDEGPQLTNEEIRRGGDLAHSGIEGSVVRCTSCHIGDSEVGKVIPAIDGQNAGYIREQMRLFRAGGRGDTSSYNPMVDASQNLTDSDIEQVAAYYASRPPRAKKIIAPPRGSR